MEQFEERISAHSELFKQLAKTLEYISNKFDDLEKRIASLEPKPSEKALSHTINDFEGAGATKVPAGENESDTERLKGLMQPRAPLPDFFE